MVIPFFLVCTPTFLYFFFFSFTIISYICNVFTPTLRPEVTGGGERHIDNGVFIRFGFDCSKSWKNYQTNVKDKATEDARGYVNNSPYCIC